MNILENYFTNTLQTLKYKNLSENEIRKSSTNLGNVKNLKVYVNLFIAKHFEGKKIK